MIFEEFDFYRENRTKKLLFGKFVKLLIFKKIYV
jgi:hypothetical protein